MTQEDNLFALLGDGEFQDISNLVEIIKKEKVQMKESRKEKVQKEKKEDVIEVEPTPIDMRAKRIILPKEVSRTFIVFDKKKQREEEEARAKANGSTEGSAAAGSEAKSISSSESNNGDNQSGYRCNYKNGNGYRQNNGGFHGGYNGYPRKNKKSNGNTNGGKYVLGEDGFMHRVRNGSIPTNYVGNGEVSTDSVDEKEANTTDVIERYPVKSEDGDSKEKEANTNDVVEEEFVKSVDGVSKEKEGNSNDVVEKDSGKFVDGDNEEKEARTTDMVEKKPGKFLDGDYREDVPVTEDKAVENPQGKVIDEEEERKMEERAAEAKLMTLKQYEEIQRKKREALENAKIAEQRRVDEKDFESMKRVGKKKVDFQIEKTAENKHKKEDKVVDNTSQKGGQKKISIEGSLFRWPSNRNYRNGPYSGRFFKTNGDGNHYQQNGGTRPYAGRNYNEQNGENLNDTPAGERNNNEQQTVKKVDEKLNYVEANQQQVGEKINNDSRPNGEKNDSRRNEEKVDVRPNGDQRNNYSQNHYDRPNGQRNKYKQNGGAPFRRRRLPLPPNIADAALFPALTNAEVPKTNNTNGKAKA